MLEILKGKYKKRKIVVRGHMRPPLQKMRLFIFDLLEKYIDLSNKIVVDICAGTGSFGLECISRDSQFVYFIEEDITTVQNLKQTLVSWDILNASVVKCNVNYLPKATIMPDLLFFDPPFGHKYIEKALNRLIDKDWINNNTLILIRTDYDLSFNKLNLLNEDKFGISHIYLYKGINKSYTSIDINYN